MTKEQEIEFGKFLDTQDDLSIHTVRSAFESGWETARKNLINYYTEINKYYLKNNE